MPRAVLTVLSALTLWLGAASPLLAQGAPPAARTTSWFEMFLWSDNLLGLILIWVIILMSFVAVALIIQFLLKYRRATLIPDQLAVQIEQMLAEKRYREAIDFAGTDPSYLGKLTNAALTEAANGYPAMERAIEETADAETTKLLRPIELLNVLGNISPMLGLFGTVYGMIVAFQTLVSSGGKPNPGELAAGISTALVTTFWGLVVAMPALAAYALIRNRIDALTSEGVLMAEDLIRPFKPGGGGAKKSSSPGTSATGAGSPPPRATPKPTEAPAT